MKPETHTSPDALLKLISEPTRTIDADHPEGFDDWIIALEPGPWHTHPRSLDDPTGFINSILNNKTVLAVRQSNGRVFDVEAVTRDSDDHMSQEQSCVQPGESTTYRYWSGTVLDVIGAVH